MLKILINAAKEAGKIQMKYFRSGSLSTQQKTSHQNLVTKVDPMCEQVIQQLILKGALNAKIDAKDIGFIAEEKMREHNDKHLFIIDPLDGTNNYASGYNIFATLIAYFKDGVAQCSVMYFAPTDTLFYAQAGKGAYIKTGSDKPQLLKLAKPVLADCLIASNITSDHAIRFQQLTRISNLHPHIRGFRATGCAGYDYACMLQNAFGAVIETRNYIWDIAAAYLMIKEAGGQVYDWNGKPLVFKFDNPDHTYRILTCHPSLLPSLKRFFK